jgi:Zn-dependent protease/ribosomal protein L37AE/L43A
MPTRQGSIHLFRFSGIDLYLHWSWFVVAVYEIRGGLGTYTSVTWNILEYLALFLIVTMHEFGHALACRQVGGRANQIVLWPLGGVAYVDPPPRPGATLWSIAAGPLVNVALVPVLLILGIVSASMGWAKAAPNAAALLGMVWWINLFLLRFNMLPIYPLDGGQILRSLLWLVLGRARSLMVAVILGFLSVAFIGFALWIHPAWLGNLSPTWLAILAVFMLMNCWGGLQHARALLRFAKLPRRNGFVCPECKTAPPVGELWKCGQCGQAFDTFQTGAVCPRCGMQYPVTKCLDCGRAHAMSEWAEAAVASPKF